MLRECKYKLLSERLLVVVWFTVWVHVHLDIEWPSGASVYAHCFGERVYQYVYCGLAKWWSAFATRMMSSFLRFGRWNRAELSQRLIYRGGSVWCRWCAVLYVRTLSKVKDSTGANIVLFCVSQIATWKCGCWCVSDEPKKARIFPHYTHLRCAPCLGMCHIEAALSEQ